MGPIGCQPQCQEGLATRCAVVVVLRSAPRFSAALASLFGLVACLNVSKEECAKKTEIRPVELLNSRDVYLPCVNICTYKITYIGHIYIV